MKNEFIGFYMPSEDDLKSAWKSDKTRFIFDTNVLLNLYSYGQGTLDDFFAILEKLENKIWIPHQVGLEFQYNRLEIKAREKNKFVDFEKKIDGILDTKQEIEKIFRRGRFPQLEAATEKLFNGIQPLIKEYKETLKQCNDSQPYIRTHDVIREKIDLYFQGKVGESFSEEDLKGVYREGEERYKNKVPPGFNDSKKDNEPSYSYNGIEYKRKFGDFILWKQMIEKAKSDKNIENIIFITDDEKDDWWYVVRESGKKAIGPLASLTHEIMEKGEVSLFHMYNTSAFFEAAKQFMSASVQEDSMAEIKFIHESELKPEQSTDINNGKFSQNIISQNITRIEQIIMNDIKNQLIREMDRTRTQRALDELEMIKRKEDKWG